MLRSVTAEFRAGLGEVLPNEAFPILSPDYLEEPRGLYTGNGGLLVAPGSALEVAEVVRRAAEASIPIVPFSGGTGLVGGQILVDGPEPVILSLRRMTRIRDVLPSENVLIAEAGAILADVQAAAAEQNRLFPLSLASEGSARIGGLLGTNAGGLNVLRYGSARDLCLGLEAVLPDGQIWNGLTRLQKNNTGYDLRHLLVGAEGTLGVITAAALRLSPEISDRSVAYLAVRDPAAALGLYAVAGEIAGGTISAFELIHRTGVDFLAETGLTPRSPIQPIPEWAVLVELGGQRGFDSKIAMERIFERGIDEGLVSDGVLAQSEAQSAGIWAVRETIPEANRRIGAISSHDISLPLSHLPEFIDRAGTAIAGIGEVRINCFGHVGDGNLHYNAFPPNGRARDEFTGLRDDIKRTVYDLVQELGGSFSAEHGVGRMKVGDLQQYGDPAKLSAMRAIKVALDPAGIMNPGVMFSDD